MIKSMNGKTLNPGAHFDTRVRGHHFGGETH